MGAILTLILGVQKLRHRQTEGPLRVAQVVSGGGRVLTQALLLFPVGYAVLPVLELYIQKDHAVLTLIAV